MNAVCRTQLPAGEAARYCSDWQRGKARTRKSGRIPFVEEYALHFWFWSLSRGGIWVITNVGVKLREKVD